MIVPNSLVGYTRSRKGIFAYTTKDLSYITEKTKQFSEADDFDAACVFECLAVKAYRQHGQDSSQLDAMSTMEACHRKRISDEFFAHEKQSLGLVTAFHVRNYGESRLHYLLRE